MAAPAEMATPTSASLRAGLSLTPSPIMMTLRPAACSARMKAALSSGRTSERYSSTPTAAATERAVRSLSPVIITSLVTPRRRSSAMMAGASARRGSSTQRTAASLPEMARNRWEYWSGRAAKRSSSPSGRVQPSSWKTKW